MPKKKLKSKGRSNVAARPSGRKNMAVAIIALGLNMLILPGIGSLVAGKSRTGAWQLFTWLAGAIAVSFAWVYSISILYIGTPVVIAAWIWGIITGAKLVQESM